MLFETCYVHYFKLWLNTLLLLEFAENQNNQKEWNRDADHKWKNNFFFFICAIICVYFKRINSVPQHLSKFNYLWLTWNISGSLRSREPLESSRDGGPWPVTWYRYSLNQMELTSGMAGPMCYRDKQARSLTMSKSVETGLAHRRLQIFFLI